MSRIARLALVLVCVCGFQSRSYGWGCSGHEIIALIAERQLDPHAQQQVQALLSENTLYTPDLSRFCVHTSLSAGVMPFYSTWADDYREQDEETAVWHFWNVPVQAAIAPAASQFCNHGCVVQAIQEQVTLLESNASDMAKARALAFIIHLVGDLHQPLHVSNNNDRGGNCVPVTFLGKTPRPAAHGSFTPNLHEIWDHNIPEKLGSIHSRSHMQDVRRFSDTLMREFTAQIAQWKSEPVDIRAWALESHKIAVEDAYGKLPHHVTPENPTRIGTCKDDHNVARRMLALHENVDEKYVNEVKPALEEQLAKAGARLAMLLNQVWP